MIFDSEEDSINDLWTTGRLIDELFLNLISIKEIIYNDEGRPVTVHKYYHQAREKMLRIPITKGKGRTSFVIHISHLTEKVGKELIDYYADAGKQAFTIVLKQAVSKIFESLDFEYTHISIMKNLTVRFIE